MAKIQIDDALLVALVQENNVLYDRKSQNYKDPIAKDRAWIEIAKNLNVPSKYEKPSRRKKPKQKHPKNYRSRV